MANNFDSNFTRKLARVFTEHFEANRVLSKNVDTQLLDGKFAPDSGDKVDFKRPTDYKSIRTSDGDLTGQNQDIITGKSTGEVQDYISVPVSYTEADQAIKMDQLDQLLAPAARRIVTDLELDFARFAMKNTALVSGDVGTAVSTWDHVADAGANMDASGVPMDSDWCYFMNPFTQTKLASNQRSLGAVDPLVKSAHERAVVSDNFAGMRVMTANTLGSYRTDTVADRAGTLASNPLVTYLGAKDTMTQQLAVTGFGANLVVKAGEVISISGRSRLNLATREAMIDGDGAEVVFRGTVTEEVTLDGSGAGTLVVTGPAIYEANGAYNTVDSAPVSGDVVTLGGADDKLIQPNLAWHKQAFGIGSVPMEKLYATDTIATTEDGLQIRVTKFADGTANKQLVRFDLRPAYATFNPFFALKSFGS